MSNITSFLQKSFQSFASSIILPLNSISFQLVKAAKAGSYVETLGEHADSLHIWIKQSYEEDFRKAFELQVRKAVQRLHVSYAQLAFDTTDEPFYGKTRGLYVFNTKGEAYGGLFKFISVSLIVRNKQIPLMSLPVMVGEGNARPAISLLKYCQTLFKHIRLALFDRGFYIAELIDYLEANGLRYIILVPEKDGVIEEYVAQTAELGKFKHKMVYAKAKSKWKPTTTIVVCKGLDDYSWIFCHQREFFGQGLSTCGITSAGGRLKPTSGLKMKPESKAKAPII